MNKLIFLSLVFGSLVARGSSDAPKADATQPKKPTEIEAKNASGQVQAASTKTPLTLDQLMEKFGDTDETFISGEYQSSKYTTAAHDIWERLLGILIEERFGAGTHKALAKELMKRREAAEAKRLEKQRRKEEAWAAEEAAYAARHCQA